MCSRVRYGAGNRRTDCRPARAAFGNTHSSRPRTKRNVEATAQSAISTAARPGIDSDALSAADTIRRLAAEQRTSGDAVSAPHDEIATLAGQLSR